MKIIVGDALTVLKTLPDESVHCCVTSPPYYGLRDYGIEGQLGLEKTPEEYVSKLVGIFREVKRVLRDDGTLWLNLGDSYATHGSSRGIGQFGIDMRNDARNARSRDKIPAHKIGMKEKDLVGIPWLVAFALRADGWYLRSDIIWHKPNPMPESVKDRPTKSHEYIFLLSKSAKYYYDADAVREPVQPCSVARLNRAISNKHKNINGAPGQTPHTLAQPRPNKNYKRYDASNAPNEFEGSDHLVSPFDPDKGRNIRSVWTITTQPYPEAHFATFPRELPELCIKAGCPVGGTVLDPFAGSGTVGEVARNLNRNFILIELNPEYIKLQEKRSTDLFCQPEIVENNPCF